MIVDKGASKPLADRIRGLTNRVEADLNASLDYYVHTIAAWRLVQQYSDEGKTLQADNKETGTVVDQSGLARLGQTYVAGYLAESVFQHFVSLLEDFLFGLLEAWLMAHPGGIPRKEGKSVDLATILDAADKDSILRFVIERELDGLKYKRPVAWFGYLNERVKLGGPTEDEVERIAEIKASRDILVHNRGVVNETYLEKAGARARFVVGDRLDIEEPYLRQSWTLIRSVVADLSGAAIAKA